MQKPWTAKDERMYEHIKEQQTGDGKSLDLAKEVAARTVNKQRRKRGDTPNTKTQGTGNPNRSLDDRTRDELYNRAKRLKIPRRSTMSKSELIAAIRSAQARP
jgi:hypothetical protein